MSLEYVHSFLVHPSKAEKQQPRIGGTKVALTGSLGKMLTNVFEKASEECDIEIQFLSQAGKQQNPCRDLLVAYAADPSIPKGRNIAARLQSITTNRSRLGLLFLMKGTNSGVHKLVVSRFAADQGVIAEEDRDQLSIEFIERVFMKSARAYKSVFYESDSFERGFWDGRAIDHQISGPRELSDYWIQAFLASDLRTTGPAGTKRIAVALREAIKKHDSLETRQELIGAATVLRNQHGQTTSARQLVQQLGLSGEAEKAIETTMPRPELMNEMFRFDRDEFQKHVQYRLVELDNGGLLVADDSEFDSVFHEELIDEARNRVRYTTEGKVVDSRLRTTK